MSAKSVFFEARKLHIGGVMQKMYDDRKLPVPVSLQRYNCWDPAGAHYVRLETTMIPGEANATKLFIKNQDGIWDVLPNCIAEVSTIFRRDNLLGTFPFLRLMLVPQYPYELSTEELAGDGQRVVIKGCLAAKPPHCEEDIASKCSYALNRADGGISSLDETTFYGRELHLIFDKLNLDKEMNDQLFNLPDRPRIALTNMSQYMALQVAQGVNHTMS